MSDIDCKGNVIYVFRCNEGALYAFTVDRTGPTIPSHIYPRISWRLERCVTLHRRHNSENKELIEIALKAIKKHGFYLTPAGAELVRLAD